MPDQITNYKCPACGGPLRYGGASGKLECDYCGSSFSVAEIEALYAEKDDQAAEAAEQAAEQASANAEADSPFEDGWGKDGEHIKVYHCPSCGAELICDENTAASSCPYCGNNAIVPGQLHGALKPDLVIPFRIEKKAAVAALKNYYKGKKLLPKSFSDNNHIEKIQGVYVPFWLYDGEAEADISYDATRTMIHTTGREQITITEFYDVRRVGTVDFQKIPVDASTKMPDGHMDAIEPYDYSELKPFSTAYLPGYLADKYDLTAEECAHRADERASNTAETAVRSSVGGYMTCTEREKNVTLHRSKAYYALLPVWMLHTKWQGKDFLFAMNGQTGKLVGDLPVDKGRYLAWFAGIAVGIAAVLTPILLYML